MPSRIKDPGIRVVDWTLEFVRSHPGIVTSWSWTVAAGPTERRCEYVVRIHTKGHDYIINGHAGSRGDSRGYLGCIVRENGPKGRGNDLTDGTMDRDTWNRIENDILRYEGGTWGSPLHE